MTRVPSIKTVALAGGLSALCGWLAWSEPAPTLQAGGEDNLIDSDGDFLPDVIEWAVLTNANNPDTDGDGVDDYVEVVQRGMPHHPNPPLPQDHELRVVMTGPGPGNANEPTYLHLLFRFFGGTNLVSSMNTWLEVPLAPGVHIPLNVLSFNNLLMADEHSTSEGYWLRISVPMVSEQELRNYLPCRIWSQANIGGNQITTGVRLLDVNGTTCTLVRFGQGHVLQTIGVMPAMPPVSNRVCELTLQAVSTGSTQFEITDAECKDCNELECGSSCPQSIGNFITIPGGLQGL